MAIAFFKILFAVFTSSPVHTGHWKIVLCCAFTSVVVSWISYHWCSFAGKIKSLVKGVETWLLIRWFFILKVKLNSHCDIFQGTRLNAPTVHRREFRLDLQTMQERYFHSSNPNLCCVRVSVENYAMTAKRIGSCSSIEEGSSQVDSVGSPWPNFDQRAHLIGSFNRLTCFHS